MLELVPDDLELLSSVVTVVLSEKDANVGVVDSPPHGIGDGASGCLQPATRQNKLRTALSWVLEEPTYLTMDVRDQPREPKHAL